MESAHRSKHSCASSKRCADPADLHGCIIQAQLGLKLSDDVVPNYDLLRQGHKFHYIMFTIDADSKVVIADSLASDQKFEYSAFQQKIASSKEPAYAVLDFNYTTEDQRSSSKILFIHWSPDTASVKSKMKYAAAKDQFKAKLNGIAKAVQANDQKALDHKELVALCNAK